MNKNRLLPIVLFAITVLMCIAINASNFIAMVQSWSEAGMWRYLIIPFALFMVWIDRARFKNIHIKSEAVYGSILLGVASLCTVIAHLTLLDFVTELSITLSLLALVLLFLGKEPLLAILWPIGYLFFMISIVGNVIPRVEYFMQLNSAYLAEIMLDVIGWPALRTGTYLRLPGIVLNVGKWCSGVNQLTSLLSLSIPLAFIFHKKLWQRLLLILCAVPISLFLNGVRIFLIGIWNYNGGRESIHGPKEILLIPVIYPFAILMLYGISKIINRFSLKKSVPAETQLPSTTSPFINLSVISSISALAILCLTSFFLFLFQPKSTSLTEKLELPDSISEYTSVPGAAPPSLPMPAAHPDSVISKTYVNDTGDTVSVTLFCFRKQTPTNKVPLKRYLWQKEDLIKDSIFTATNGSFFKFNSSDFGGGEVQHRHFYWYMNSNNHTTDDPLQFHFTTMSEMLKNRRNSGVLAVVSYDLRRNYPGNPQIELRMKHFVTLLPLQLRNR